MLFNIGRILNELPFQQLHAHKIKLETGKLCRPELGTVQTEGSSVATELCRKQTLAAVIPTQSQPNSILGFKSRQADIWD